MSVELHVNLTPEFNNLEELEIGAAMIQLSIDKIKAKRDAKRKRKEKRDNQNDDEQELSDTIDCACGMSIKKNNLKRHEKSQFHKSKVWTSDDDND